MLYMAREDVGDFYDDYFLMVSEAKCKAIKGKWLKMLTCKQILQRLPIALAQI